MKKINAAYDMLTKKQESSSSYGPGSSQGAGYGGYNYGGYNYGGYSYGGYSGGGYSGGSQDRGGQGMPATPPPPMETGDDEDIPF